MVQKELFDHKTGFIDGIHDTFAASFNIADTTGIEEQRRDLCIQTFSDTIVDPPAFILRKGIYDFSPPITDGSRKLLEFRNIGIDKVFNQIFQMRLGIFKGCKIRLNGTPFPIRTVQ